MIAHIIHQGMIPISMGQHSVALHLHELMHVFLTGGAKAGCLSLRTKESYYFTSDYILIASQHSAMLRKLSKSTKFAILYSH